ncbi:MAG: alpha-galactosidase [Phycicoccus sp.]|nr:alpha-galactosidase [Phycicoccus sp.]
MPLLLQRSGTALLLRLTARALPCIVHWGPALDGPPDASALWAALSTPLADSTVNTQESVAILPQHSAGWLGRPGLLGSRNGRDWSTTFDTVTHVLRGGSADPMSNADGLGDGPLTLSSEGVDSVSGLVVGTDLELTEQGVVRVRAWVRNTGAEPYQVDHLEPALPVPSQASELLDFTGRHAHERHPQRRPFDIGSWVRESWGGRPGHDSATLLCAGTTAFGFRRGQVWGAHVAWGGNQVTYAERAVTGWRLLRGGERLLPGEVRLAQDETYTSPWLVGTWGEGLDDASGRLHRMLRARPQHSQRPRPVLLNTWEAVYFDMDLTHLIDLAEQAAAIGVERYVLDDGWFGARRDDRAGLGDWVVATEILPQGLHPLVDRVHGLGMEFGLWFEPEMVNLDSDVARAHPDWVLQSAHGPGMASRHQHVLDLTHPDAYAHVRDQMSALIAEYDIAYLKWDHNRPLLDAGHGEGREPGVHAQAVASQALMAELKGRHPGLEIESCAGGGGRIDLSTAEVTDRVWVSDCIDAHERHRLVRGTGLILPPELLGTHIGSGADHTTGRHLSLDFRAGTALWGHFGIEWDLSAASQEDRARLAAWVAFHKAHRALLHSGTVVHADMANDATQLDGVVALDQSEALYRFSMLDHSLVWPPGRIALPGLDEGATYQVTVPGPQVVPGLSTGPQWLREPIDLSGRFLGTVGLQAPALPVDELVLIRAERVGS